MGPTFFIALVGGRQGLNESLLVVRLPSMFGWVLIDFDGFSAVGLLSISSNVSLSAE